MTMSIICLVCGGDKWSGMIPGGLHCSACKSPMGTRPEREEPCTSGTLSNGYSKIGYLPSEVLEMENHFYLGFRDTDKSRPTQEQP